MAVIALVPLLVLISLWPTPPNDLYWHMRVGQLIAETGQIPTTSLFAWTVPADAPYVYGAWLGELLLYRLHQVGGVELLVFTRNMLAGALLWIVALEAQRRSGSWRAAGLAVVGAGILLVNNLAVRPQMFAWLPFGLTLLFLGWYADRRLGARALAVALSVLMVFWVNVHGSFVLGLLLVGGALAGALVERRWGPGHDLKAGWDPAQLRGLALALGAMALATLANPRGPAIASYVTTLLTDVPTQRLIVEWQPPTPGDWVSQWFFLSILALLVAWAGTRTPPRASDLVLACGLLWLAWHGTRYMVWYGIVVMPMLAAALIHRSARHDDGSAPAPTGMTFVLAMLLLVPILLAQPWFAGRSGDQSDARVSTASAPPRLVTRDTPIAATTYLRDHPGGKLFNDLAFGSYLIWALPDQQVFVDPRLELYPLELVEDYIAMSHGREAVALLDRYGANRVLLNRATQGRLAAALAQSGAWEREYLDDAAEVWRKAS